MIKRIFADNFNSLASVGGTIDLKLPPDCLILDNIIPVDEDDEVINFLEILFNDFLKNFVLPLRIIPYNNKEGITVEIETDTITYTKILSPDGRTVVMEELIDKPTRKSYFRGLDDMDGKPFMMLKKALYSNFSDDIFYVFGNGNCRFGGDSRRYSCGESDEVIELCNKIIPQIFPGVISVEKNGAGVHKLSDSNKTITFEREVEGGGYNQALDIVKGLYLVLNTESIVVFKYWANHLHPILRNWFMDLFKDLGKKNRYKGTLLINDYSELFK